jgi:hypothetical protein
MSLSSEEVRARRDAIERRMADAEAACQQALTQAEILVRQARENLLSAHNAKRAEYWVLQNECEHQEEVGTPSLVFKNVETLCCPDCGRSRDVTIQA